MKNPTKLSSVALLRCLEDWKELLETASHMEGDGQVPLDTPIQLGIERINLNVQGGFVPIQVQTYLTHCTKSIRFRFVSSF